MEVIIPGHKYLLAHLDGDGTQELSFVNRGHNCDEEGTTNQEVLRALIDRIKFLDNECPWEGNKNIIYHLRMGLLLHETRALERKVEKGQISPEFIPVNKDDLHFQFKE